MTDCPRTYFAEDLQRPIPHSDVSFILNAIRDNDYWNSHGLTAPDISLCFELSALCEYGVTFTVARFKAALREALASKMVVQVGERYYHRTSPALKGDRPDDRTCQAPRCGKDISWDRRGLYCSTSCQRKAAAQRRRSGSESVRMAPAIDSKKSDAIRASDQGRSEAESRVWSVEGSLREAI